MFKFVSLFFVLFFVSTTVAATPYNGPAVLIHKYVVNVSNTGTIITGAFSQKYNTTQACNDALDELAVRNFPAMTYPAPPLKQSQISFCTPFDQ